MRVRTEDTFITVTKTRWISEIVFVEALSLHVNDVKFEDTPRTLVQTEYFGFQNVNIICKKTFFFLYYIIFYSCHYFTRVYFFK